MGFIREKVIIPQQPVKQTFSEIVVMVPFLAKFSLNFIKKITAD